MKTITLKTIIIISILIGIQYTPLTKDKINIQTKKQKEYIVNVKINNKINKIKLNDYLLGVIAGEMPAEFNIEALKAQAVASRTFVMSRKFNVDNTTNSQVYLTDKEMKKKWGKDYKKYKDKINKAIIQTHNEIMTYNGKCISALFFSSSNGKTNNSEDYFGDKTVYLRSVQSPWDLKIDKHNKKRYIYTNKQLANIFHTNIKQLKIMSYTQGGYIKTILVNNKKYTGRQVREMLGLASSSFNITLSKNKYIFITSGSGHGVGMSQYGAQGMAIEKKTYKQILNHYYKNITIESI